MIKKDLDADKKTPQIFYVRGAKTNVNSDYFSVLSLLPSATGICGFLTLS